MWLSEGSDVWTNHEVSQQKCHFFVLIICAPHTLFWSYPIGGRPNPTQFHLYSVALPSPDSVQLVSSVDLFLPLTTVPVVRLEPPYLWPH